jgi:hypothetical protein
VNARIAIDASGAAAAAALGGAETDISSPEALQLPSFIFQLAGVEADALEELQGFGRLRVTRAVAGATKAGVLPPGCESVLVRPGVEPGSVYVTLNVPRPEQPVWDPIDPEAVAAVQASARTSAERLVDYLRKSRAAFARCRVERWPARIGIREGRRVVSRCDVVGEDVRTGRRRDDEVAVSTWPIELWRDHRRAQFEYPKRSCSVPLGALLSRSHPGLAVAGRCLGADADALGALRVIGTALATGEAAGVAAAIAADAGCGLADVAAEAVRKHIQERAAVDPGGLGGVPEEQR